MDKARKETEGEQRAKELEAQKKAQIAKVASYEHRCQLSRCAGSLLIILCLHSSIKKTCVPFKTRCGRYVKKGIMKLCKDKTGTGTRVLYARKLYRG